MRGTSRLLVLSNALWWWMTYLAWYNRWLTHAGALLMEHASFAGWSPIKIIRRAGFAFFGVFNGTEVNPYFAEEFLSIDALQDPEKAKTTPVVVVCQFGGTLTPTVNMKNGKQSRHVLLLWNTQHAISVAINGEPCIIRSSLKSSESM